MLRGINHDSVQARDMQHAGRLCVGANTKVANQPKRRLEIRSDFFPRQLHSGDRCSFRCEAQCGSNDVNARGRIFGSNDHGKRRKSRS